MRKVLLSIALASASLAAAAPAAAQGYGHGYGHGYSRGSYGGQDIAREIDRLESRIARGAQRGRISGREAYSLRREAHQLQGLYYRFARNGLSRGEHRDLSVRLARLQSRLRYERADRDGRRY